MPSDARLLGEEEGVEESLFAKKSSALPARDLRFANCESDHRFASAIYDSASNSTMLKTREREREDRSSKENGRTSE